MITRWNIRASISTAIIFVGIMLCATVNAQNSNLPPCPKGQGVVLNDCFGALTLTDGRKYTGEWKNGKRNGQGITIFPNGEKYVGEYKDGERYGKGTQTWSDGAKYVGEWKDGLRSGQGIFYAANGSVSREGIWAEDKFIRQSNLNPTSPPLTASSPPVSTPKSSSGTAFRISNGQFVTNHHVVDGCNMIKVGGMQGGRVLSSDPINDLALIAIPNDSGEIASIRTTRTQLNEAVTAAGFPLQGAFTGIAITNGTISRLSGLKGDTGQVQISAPVQPGNSGGPLLDSAGNVIGVVSGKLNAMKVAGIIGDVPQNVNFAITGNALRAFLDAKGVNYKEVGRDADLRGEQIAARASGFTVLVECR